MISSFVKPRQLRLELTRLLRVLTCFSCVFSLLLFASFYQKEKGEFVRTNSQKYHEQVHKYQFAVRIMLRELSDYGKIYEICIYFDRKDTTKTVGRDTSMSSDGYFFLSIRTWFEKGEKVITI